MTELREIHCVACEGGIPPLSRQEVNELITQTPSWKVSQDGQWLSRKFGFKNYYQTIAFVNAIAWMTHQQNHHPDMEVGYNYCHIRYTTHAVNGLTKNDFICAAKINELIGDNII